MVFLRLATDVIHQGVAVRRQTAGLFHKGIRVGRRIVQELSPAFCERALILLSHKTRHRVFVYASGLKMWYLGRSFSGSGDRNGRRFE